MQLLVLFLQKLTVQELLCRSAIFKHEGVCEDGLSDEDKAAILEEILSTAESNFGYHRTMVENPRFPVLTKYLFCYSSGLTTESSTTSSRQASSEANLKKHAKMALELFGSDGQQPTEESVEVSASYKLADAKNKELGAYRIKLAKNLEELLQLTAEVREKQDDALEKKAAELGTASSSLQNCLDALRSQLARKLPDKSADCQKLVDELDALLQQSGAHELGSKTAIKTWRNLLQAPGVARRPPTACHLGLCRGCPRVGKNETLQKWFGQLSSNEMLFLYETCLYT